MVLDHVNTLSCKDILLFPDCIPYFFHLRADTDQSILSHRPIASQDSQFLQNDNFFFYQVPDPVAFFPLNAAYGTKEIDNRTEKGIPRGVILAPGPNGRHNYSYKFSGSSNSYIKFPNSIGGPLDVRYSMTMLCWVYCNGKGGPLFSYGKSSTWAVQFRVLNEGKLFVHFKKRDYSETKRMEHTNLAGGWKFVGASYDRSSGEAKLWVNGAVVQTLNIGAGLELATQDSIRMGARAHTYFKGRIAQMRIYNRALTQEQIQAIQKLVVAGNEKKIK